MARGKATATAAAIKPVCTVPAMLFSVSVHKKTFLFQILALPVLTRYSILNYFFRFMF
jgi:hypothetical protein